MTYIEFFDKVASENICACLTYAPERVIYLGDNTKLMLRHIDNYKKVFALRGYEGVEFIAEEISKYNLENAVKVLTRIVESYDNCVFDITGGEEILNLALGLVWAKYPDKSIQIHRFNLRNNEIHDCDSDGKTIFKTPPTLSVEENIKIYGGEIDRENTPHWDLSEEFLADLRLIWEKCREDVRCWNMQIGIFEAVEELAEETGGVDADGLTSDVSMERLKQRLAKRGFKYKKATGIIKYLLGNGLLKSFRDEGGKITVSYKNGQVKKCLTKAGQALEMKIFLTAKSLLDERGTPVYNDALNGVVIDWDGKFHDEETEQIYDTENEIDVMLMHDVVPVFVSCKNGVMDADELYKLDTVAGRFGGTYAKKVLVATSISNLGEKGLYLRQRAKDMGIRLIEGVQYMTDESLKAKLKNLWNN